MKKILLLFLLLITGISCYATDPIKIFESKSERMYFYPDCSSSFNDSDGRSGGYTVLVRRIWTVPKNGAKSIDLVLEFNSNWSKVRLLKWFEIDVNNKIINWETTKPKPWQNVSNGTVAGNIRDGVRKYF